MLPEKRAGGSEGRASFVDVFRIEEATAFGSTVERMGRIGHGRKRPQVHPVIGDGVEIERAIELDPVAGGMFDRLPARIAVGVVGRSAGAENERVEGITGMDVQIAEVGIALPACGAGRGARYADRQRGDAMDSSRHRSLPCW